MDDDDLFPDDDLDDIPDTTLQELERNALASTQLPRPASRPAPVTKHSVNSNATGRLVGAPAQPRQNLAYRPPQVQQKPFVVPRRATPVNPAAPQSSDYGLDEGDVVDLSEQWPARSRPTTRPTSVAGASRPTTAAGQRKHGSKSPLDPETEAAYAAADAELALPNRWNNAAQQQKPATNGVDMAALQARVAELEAEQTRLRQAEQEARSAAAIKQGEIAIVRANQEKATKEYERRIAVMQKLHAEDAAKAKAELEANRKEREKMETDNRFLQHDLAQEAERAKRLNGPSRARVPSLSGRETPRKTKRTGLGDGFDDDEVYMVSPSRSKDRAKESTPKHAAKRRRTANDSPIGRLSLTQAPAPMREESSEQPAASADLKIVAVPPTDSRFDFMQRLLRHFPYEGHERTVEALTKHFLPSADARSLATMLMDRITQRPVRDEPESLPLTTSRACIELWKRCLAEQFYKPLYLLIDLINLALYNELSDAAVQLIEEAIPTGIQTIDAIAPKKVRAARNPTFAATVDFAELGQLEEDLCVDEVMDLLLRLCQAASLHPGRLEGLWRQIHLRFTLEMLSSAQSASQITCMLRMLSTSILPATFGPISGEVETQASREMNLVSRLINLMHDTLVVPFQEPPYTDAEIAELHLGILKLLKAMCITDHGGLLLAQNRIAIGGLIKFINAQVKKLCIVPSPFNTAAEQRTHQLIADNINLSMRIFYYLLRTHEDIIDLAQKLSAVRGSNQKFWICMSRIAFSEQLVLERGIEDEVMELAHRILDNFLSPEEGDAMRAAVETPRGTKGSSLHAVSAADADVTRQQSVVDGDTTMSEPG